MQLMTIVALCVVLLCEAAGNDDRTSHPFFGSAGRGPWLKKVLHCHRIWQATPSAATRFGAPANNNSTQTTSSFKDCCATTYEKKIGGGAFSSSTRLIKGTAVSSFPAAGGFFLSMLRNPTSSHYPSSFGLVLPTRRVGEDQPPPASAGGMLPEEVTLSTSSEDIVMI